MYKSHETIFGEMENAIEFKSLNVDSILKNPIVRTPSNSNLLLNAQFFLSPKRIEIKRVTYGLLHAITELGGLLKVLQVTFSILVMPIA